MLFSDRSQISREASNELLNTGVMKETMEVVRSFRRSIDIDSIVYL